VRPARVNEAGYCRWASHTTSTGCSACFAEHEPSRFTKSDARTIHGLASSSMMTGSRLRFVSNSSDG